MGAVGFNTLDPADDLRAAGLDEAHAKAIVGAMYEAMSEGVATKEHVSAEIAALRSDISAEIAALRSDISAEIAALRSDMLKTAIGIVVANVTVTVSLLKLLP